MQTATLAPTKKQLTDKQINDQRLRNAKDLGLVEPEIQKNNGSALSNAEEEYNNWQQYLNVKADNITIKDQNVDIPVTIEVPFEQALEIAKKEADAAERRSAVDMADLVATERALTQNQEFSASGSMPFDVSTEAVAEAGRIITEHHDNFVTEQASAVAEAERIFSEKSEQSDESEPSAFAEASADTSENTVIAGNEVTKQSQGLEPLIEDEHTREPQEFSENKVDLVRHHPDVDFGYFFGWLGGQVESGGRSLFKAVINTKQWVDTKMALFDDLFVKQILGFGTKKKELTKEEEAKQKMQAANKRSFFDSLRAGAARVMSIDRKRGLKSRIETLNKTLKRGNLSYEGDLDANGQIRESVLLEEELANSQKSSEQLLAEKKRKMMMATPAKAKSGPGVTMSSDKAHNFNNAAKLAG